MSPELPKKGVNGHHQVCRVISTNQFSESCLRVCHYVKNGERNIMSVEDVHELEANGDGFKFHHGARVKSHGSSHGHKTMLTGPSGEEGRSLGSPPP